MKAVVCHGYGSPEVLSVEDAASPFPGKHEIAVRVRAATVCALDVRLRKADPFLVRLMLGLTRPKRAQIPGVEFSGTIEQVGRAVTRWHAGEQVFGATGFKFGAHGERVCTSERFIAMKPRGVSFEEAAAIPFGGGTALHFLRKAQPCPGQKVLIYGASGSVGTYAVQLAKHFGAHVTAVCSTANLDLVKRLGADNAIDYTREDFTKAGPVYDIVFDIVGKSGFRRSMRALKRGGMFLWAVGPPSWLLAGLLVSAVGSKKAKFGVSRIRAEDFVYLAGLVQAGKMIVVIDRHYPLSAIAEAHRYAETGHKKGNVVITVSEGGDSGQSS